MGEEITQRAQQHTRASASPTGPHAHDAGPHARRIRHVGPARPRRRRGGERRAARDPRGRVVVGVAADREERVALVEHDRLVQEVHARLERAREGERERSARAVGARVAPRRQATSLLRRSSLTRVRRVASIDGGGPTMISRAPSNMSRQTSNDEERRSRRRRIARLRHENESTDNERGRTTSNDSDSDSDSARLP